MGVDIGTYRSRIGTFRHGSGSEVVLIKMCLNYTGSVKVVGVVTFIGLLLLMAGIESNPGPPTKDHEQEADPLATILRNLDLGQYIDQFKQQEATLDIINQLTTADFKDIGVHKVGHRVRIREACKDYQDAMTHQNDILDHTMTELQYSKEIEDKGKTDMEVMELSKKSSTISDLNEQIQNMENAMTHQNDTLIHTMTELQYSKEREDKGKKDLENVSQQLKQKCYEKCCEESITRLEEAFKQAPRIRQMERELELKDLELSRKSTELTVLQIDNETAYTIIRQHESTISDLKKKIQDMERPETPFYLGAVTNTKNPRPNEQWFLQQAVGVNKLSSLMSTMAKKAGLPEVSEGKRITNTSIRKRLCQKLLTANVPDTQAIHITGHKNSDSLNHYRTLTNHQQRNISNILANTSSTSLPVSRPPQQLTGNNYSAMPMSTTEQGHIANSLTGNNYSAMPMSTTEQGHITNSLTGNNYSAMPMSTTEQGHITNSLTGNNYSAMPMSTTEQGHITNSLTGNNYSAMPMSTTEQGYIANSTSLAHTRKSSHVLQCSETGLPSGLFQNATINGGTFNITIMSGKRKLETTTNSDEDCLRASQEF